MGKRRILVVCGTGIATSTMVAGKLRDFLDSRGIDVELKQCLASEAVYEASDAVLIVATTQVPSSIKIPVINGVPLLTGIGVDRVFQDVIAKLQQ